MYVIVRYVGDKREFVSPNKEDVYTTKLQDAQLFETTKAATHYGVCGNESVIPLLDCFAPPIREFYQR